MSITGGVGTRALDKDYPFEEGLISETTTQDDGESPNLDLEGSDYV